MPSSAAGSPPTARADLSEAMGEVLEVLRCVAQGDLDKRLSSTLPESHPMGALTQSVNAMIDSLGEARQRSEAYSTNLREKLLAIEKQQAAIAELSTPVMEVWEGILCLPIVGAIDDARTSDMARSLLTEIVRRKARYALIDITGIVVMDTQSVDHFMRMARAVRMLGAHCALSGVHPNVSSTIVQMGIPLDGIETHRTMSDALRGFIDGRPGRLGGAAIPRLAEGAGPVNDTSKGRDPFVSIPPLHGEERRA